jgi:ribosome-associated protein
MSETKIIKIHTEFITLQQALKLADIIQDGGQSKSFIANNKIFVNGESENRRGRKLYSGYTLKVNEEDFAILNDNQQN